MQLYKLIVFTITCCLQFSVCQQKKDRAVGRKMIRTPRCKYTFVVKEVEAGNNCPASVSEQIQSDVETSGMANDVTALKLRLNTVEKQLDGEIKKNSNLNATICKQELSLQKADIMLQEYSTNFSSIYHIINLLQHSLHDQSVSYKNLEKKVSGVVLDVVEMNNILNKKVTLSDGVQIKQKEVQVESVSKVHSCGIMSPEAIYRGMMIIMGLMEASDVSLYWSSNKYLGNNGFKDIMPKNRYNKLVQYFHANDNNTDLQQGHPNYDHLHKIRPLINIVQRKVNEHYRPKQYQSIDEGMIAYKGRYGPKQYMPAKPIKWGMKVWMRCDSQSGFCHQFDIYLGKGHRQVQGKGLPQSVVEHLSQSLYGKHFHVFFDSYFTSVRLVRSLLRHGVYACGTIRKNRVGFPQDFKNINRLPTGESMARQDGNLVSTMWQDRRIVTTLSTNATALESVIVNRRQKDGSIKQLSQPQAVNKYQLHFRGVDVCDQLRAAYSVGRASKKWWKYIFNFILNICIINSFITRQESNARIQKKRYSQLDFRINLATQLIKGFRYTNRPGQVRMVPATPNQNRQGHTLERLVRKRSYCKACNTAAVKKRKDTVYGCASCNVHLCSVACSEMFHANMNIEE